MKHRFTWLIGLLVVLAGIFGYLQYQDTLVPIPLAPEVPRFVAAAPEYGEDAAVIEALLPAGEKLEAFLAAHSDLSLVDRDASGQLIGQLLAELSGTRHGRRWHLKVRPGWRLQRGGLLDAVRLGESIRSQVVGKGGEIRILGDALVELRFKARQPDLPADLSRWRVPGTGPFIRTGMTLARFEGFQHGRAGIAGLQVATDPTLFESHAWAEGLASGRWAFAPFPGQIAPEDMARVRLAAYDEIRLKDGSIWFLSRRMRRLRPDAEDWTRTRLFGVWRGSTELPFDALGM
jgi:hypothetical protein